MVRYSFKRAIRYRRKPSLLKLLKRAQLGRLKGFRQRQIPVRTGTYYGAGENKFFDVVTDDAGISAAGTITDSVNKIGQGITEKTRIGRKITITNIAWKYDILLSAATAANVTAEQVRVILYLDKQCNGAAAAVTDVLETDDYNSYRNLANISRFNILMDKVYTLIASSGSGRGATDTLAFGEDLVQDTYFKRVNIPIEFNSTAGAIGEIRSNNIGILLLSKTGAITEFNGNMRLRFSD